MAKKITIGFTTNPVNLDTFNYATKISTVPIINGSVAIVYKTTPTAINDIKIEATLSQTIEATVSFLRVNYSSSMITYAKNGDTIEVFINSETAVVTESPTSVGATVTVTTVTVDNNYYLKYYLEYKDTENVDYRVDIKKKAENGIPILIYGSATMEAGSVKDSLEPIRGFGLTLDLEANINLTLSDLYSDEENNFTVQFYRNNVLLFNGFLKPDGVFQSFVQDHWIITLDCVDGIGILKDLAFVKTDGFNWIGKMRAIDIIYNCLIRTNLSMHLNTAVNIYYEGLTASDVLDPLHEIYLNVNRFVKEDKSTIMDCEKVLKSVLNLFNACIVQQDGEWYVYRPNDLFVSSTVKFRKYDKVDNAYLSLNEKNFAFSLGSHINGFYPHHSGANQKIEIKGSVSAYRLNYKYGFVKGLFDNPNFVHSGLTYLGWTVNDSSYIIPNPLSDSFLYLKPDIVSSVLIMTSDAITLPIDSKIEIDFRVDDGYGQNIIPFIIRLGAYYLSQNGEWTLSSRVISLGLGSYKLVCMPLPIAGDVVVQIYNPYSFDGTESEVYTMALEKLNIVNVLTTKNGAQGEFHTVQRKSRPSSIAKDTEEISNGDSASLVFDGAIYKANAITPTDKWFRKNAIESLPILRIVVEDVLKMTPRPMQVFSGGAYGYIPYLSVVQIASISGKFLPIEYSFDSKNNITTVKFLEIENTDLIDIDYKLTLDFGNTVKPTITS